MSTDTGSSGVRRRDFLKILGATGAASTVVGCSTGKVEKLIPYVTNPDETVPGVSSYYATVCRECAAACGVIAETRDGRAIKLEGNPEHPLNRGALCAKGQSALQGLYNPDRYRTPMIRQGNALVPTTWAVATQRLAAILADARTKGQAGGAAFLNAHESGSFPAFLDQWLAGYGMPAHLSVDGDADLSTIAANRQSYGVAWPRLDFGSAALIVSFGADFLDDWGAVVPQQLDWADARAKLDGAPRMIYVGPRRSLTGLNADQWIACKPGSELTIVNAMRGQGTMDAAAQASGVPVSTLQGLQREIGATRNSMLLAGGRTANGTDLALAVNELNRAQGNVGTTIRPAEALAAYEGIATHADLRALAQRMNAGQVGVLMVRGANPVHTTPKSVGFRAALAKVPVKVSFSSYPDETTELCDLVLPGHHALESWGDAEPVRGTIALQQPAMDPVYSTRSTADVLISVAKADAASASRYPYEDYRAFMMSRFPGGMPGMTAALPRGVASGSTLARAAMPARAADAAAAAPAIDASTGDFYLVVYPSALLGDGRGANKPWLQELPDPVTKICWQSVVEMHPQTARRLGVENGDHVTVQTASGTITAPMYSFLGIRPDTVAIATGQGHRGTGGPFDGKPASNGARRQHMTGYGRYADGVGVNALDLLAPAEDPRSGALSLVQTKAKVSKAGAHSMLITTEGSARQHGRGIGQAVTVAELSRGTAGDHGAAEVEQKGPAPASEHGATRAEPTGSAAQDGPAGATTEHGSGQSAEEHGGEEHESYVGDASHAFLPGLRSPVANDAQGDFGDSTSKDKGMYDPKHWSGMAKRRWAMTIDLARCTGCSACVTACYAENNIPTVGAAWQGPVVMPDRTGFGANITRGREMSWIRLERYYEGAERPEEEFDPNFDTRFVPMLCQHCGNAPCEPVCPVYATYHSPDGLNVQVYNRCVGTRYCSNNCPYKVRYFNWFGYGEEDRIQYAFPEPLHWQLNPDVTVRGKGVMEKCSFCVQRIREAEHRSALEHRELEADEFTTACAQACPSRAITFGDAADAAWSVAELAVDRRAYHVFEELNTYTAVVYLKKVNHPAAGAQPATA